MQQRLLVHRGLTLVTAFLVIIAFACVTLVFGTSVADAELKKALYAGAVALLFGGVLGGWLKILFDDLLAVRTQRAETAQFVMNVLADLKSVYDRVARARILIAAHRSALTYGSEMRDLIDARVQLRNVVRAWDGRAAGIDQTARAEIGPLVKTMERYLTQLTTEFRDNYKRLSDKQRVYDERAKVDLRRYLEGSQDTDESPKFDQAVWSELASLEILSDFIASAPVSYRDKFARPLDKASYKLRTELATILGHRPAGQQFESYDDRNDTSGSDVAHE